MELKTLSDNPDERIGPWLASGLDSTQSDFNISLEEAPAEGTPVVGYRVMYHYTNKNGETFYKSPLVKFDGISQATMPQLTPGVEYDNELRSSIPVHTPHESEFGYYYFPNREQAEEYMKLIALGKLNVMGEQSPLTKYTNSFYWSDTRGPVGNMDTDIEKLESGGLGLFRVTGYADRFIPEMDTSELRREGVRMKEMQIEQEPLVNISYAELGKAGITAEQKGLSETWDKLHDWLSKIY